MRRAEGTGHSSTGNGGTGNGGTGNGGTGKGGTGNGAAPADRSFALSSVPAAGSGRRRFAGGAVKFFHGPMDCGKSTLALQLHYNHSRQGRVGLLLTKRDRSGTAMISSRIGISSPAVETADDQDIRELVTAQWARGINVDYLIVDEAQFFTTAQIEQLAALADDAQVDVYAFGIATDFRGRLFPGSARLFELADEVAPLQVEVLCWCGRIGRFNARVADGRIVREGATVMVADTGSAASGDHRVRYQVLCRMHHRSGALGPEPAAREPVPIPGAVREVRSDGVHGM